MSRYDYRDPGTDPAYCDPLRADDDTDVPDFDAPNPPIDPAEHAAHALIDALATLEQQIVLNLGKRDLERAWFLQNIVSRAFTHVDLVAGKAMDAIDQITERRR